MSEAVICHTAKEKRKFINHKTLKTMKKFSIQYNIGRAKYCLSYTDGIQTHRDGSEFWGIAIFSNKKKLNDRIKEMEKQGYKQV